MTPLHSLLTRAPCRAADLRRIHQALRASPDFLPQVLAEIRVEDESTLTAALWLLWRFAVEQGALPAAAWRTVLASSAATGPWVAQLYLYRLFSDATCPPEFAAAACDALLAGAHDRRPFLRAWALTALHRLRPLAGDERATIDVLLRRARHDPAASVQARLRQLPPAPRSRAKKTPAPPVPHTSRREIPGAVTARGVTTRRRAH